MQTIKTAVVVVLLLFVLYGGYIALNHREPELNSDLQGLVGPDVFNADVDLPEPNYAPPSSSSASRATPGSLPSAPNGSTPSNAFEAFAKNPNPSFTAPPPLSLPTPRPRPTLALFLQSDSRSSVTRNPLLGVAQVAIASRATLARNTCRYPPAQILLPEPRPERQARSRNEVQRDSRFGSPLAPRRCQDNVRCDPTSQPRC